MTYLQYLDRLIQHAEKNSVDERKLKMIRFVLQNPLD